MEFHNRHAAELIAIGAFGSMFGYFAGVYLAMVLPWQDITIIRLLPILMSAIASVACLWTRISQWRAVVRRTIVMVLCLLACVLCVLLWTAWNERIANNSLADVLSVSSPILYSAIVCITVMLYAATHRNDPQARGTERFD